MFCVPINSNAEIVNLYFTQNKNPEVKFAVSSIYFLLHNFANCKRLVTCV